MEVNVEIVLSYNDEETDWKVKKNISKFIYRLKKYRTGNRFSGEYTYKINQDSGLYKQIIEFYKSNSKDVELVFKEAIGVIDANADKGNITVDGGLLEALRGIRFDHAHGTVNISNTEVKSEVLVTGGSASSTGTTTIKDNTILKTKGTSISVGNGCSITMTGGATITQT